MPAAPTDRRHFLELAAGTLAAGWIAARPAAAAAPSALHSIRLGGPIFHPSHDPEELALAHKKLGYRAAYCPHVSLDDKDRIRDVARAFAKHGVLLAEVGRWVNLLEADPRKHSENLAKVTEGLALAEAIGARCCVDIAGSFNAKVWFGPHPDNLSQRFLRRGRGKRPQDHRRRPTPAGEIHLRSDGLGVARLARRLSENDPAVDRPAFGVHLDPCNLVNSPGHFYDTTGVAQRVFRQARPLDRQLPRQGHRLVEPAGNAGAPGRGLAGQGVLDYATCLRRLAALPADVPLMLEHLKTAEEYDQVRQYIMATGGRSGVCFQ